MASGRVIIVSDGSSLLARAPVSESTSGSAASSGAGRRLGRDDNRSWLAARMARENASSQSLRTVMEYLFSARLVGARRHQQFRRQAAEAQAQPPDILFGSWAGAFRLCGLKVSESRDMQSQSSDGRTERLPRVAPVARFLLRKDQAMCVVVRNRR